MAEETKLLEFLTNQIGDNKEETLQLVLKLATSIQRLTSSTSPSASKFKDLPLLTKIKNDQKLVNAFQMLKMIDQDKTLGELQKPLTRSLFESFSILFSESPEDSVKPQVPGCFVSDKNLFGKMIKISHSPQNQTRRSVPEGQIDSELEWLESGLLLLNSQAFCKIIIPPQEPFSHIHLVLFPSGHSDLIPFGCFLFTLRVDKYYPSTEPLLHIHQFDALNTESQCLLFFFFFFFKKKKKGQLFKNKIF